MTISMRSGMPGTRICGPEKDAVLEHEQSKNLAQRFVANGQHEKADQLHRQHHGQRQNRDGPAEIEGGADAVATARAKMTAKAPITRVELT